MEHRFSVDLDAPPDRVLALVSDLGSYGRWLDLVHRVEPADGPDAWLVTLRARIGPLARSKRLRMVRVPTEDESRVRFERAETDGREHAPWVLESLVEAGPTRLTMWLTYGGRLWTSALDGVLDAQVDRATTKLEALAAG